MSWIEWLAAALVLINVALVALRSVWNYPFALVAVSLYAFVFFVPYAGLKQAVATEEWKSV